MPAKKLQQPKRSTSQIESDLDATRQRLTSSVETLIDQVHPNRVKQRQKARLETVVEEQKQKAKAQFFTARGDLRTNRVAAIAGGVASVLTLLVLLRRARGRRA